MRFELATPAGLLALLFALSPAADLGAASPTVRLAANETATADATGDRAEAIARQTALLGDPSYSVRERATKNLIDAGIAGRPLLERLRSSPDREVRARAAKVLRIVMETDFRVRLRAFSADIDGHRGISLPGWDRFRREAGESREARQLFVSMQRGEATLLEALASGDPTIGELFGQRCQELQSSLSTPDPFAAAQADGDDPAKAGAIAALLFVGAAPEVKLEEQQALWVENLLGHVPFKEALGAGEPSAPLYQQLVSRWLVKAGMLLPYHCLLHSFEWGLKDASLTLARKLLASGGAALNDRAGVPDARPYALLAFGRFGSREDLPLVESFFEVDKVCLKFRRPNPKSAASRHNAMDVEVRDVALAVAAHLTGQDLRGAYGYRYLSNPQFLFVVATLGFPDEAARQKAFQTWADWKAHQPPAKTAAD